MTDLRYGVLYFGAIAGFAATPQARLMAAGAPRTFQQIRGVGAGTIKVGGYGVSKAHAAFKIGHTAGKVGVTRAAPAARFLGRIVKSPVSRRVGMATGRVGGAVFKKVLLPWAVAEGIFGIGKGTVQTRGGPLAKLHGGVVGGIAGFTGIPAKYVDFVI